MKTQVENNNFADFYEKWICKVEEYHQLLSGIDKNHSENQEEKCEALVNKLTSHHKEFYTVKWAAAHNDVFAFFAPVWLTPLENAYLWITGWKPSMVFRLVDSLRKFEFSSLSEMSEEQLKKTEALRMKIKIEEERVEREMARQQMAMADRSMVELVNLVGRVKTINDAAALSQVDGLVEVALKNLMAGLEKVMKMADCARLKTLKGVLDILKPNQCVNFLAALSMIHIQMRKWGKKRLEDK